jgi:hypothetical protein
MFNKKCVYRNNTAINMAPVCMDCTRRMNNWCLQQLKLTNEERCTVIQVEKLGLG